MLLVIGLSLLGACSEKINQTDCKKIALAKNDPDKIEKLDAHEKKIYEFLEAKYRNRHYGMFYHRCLDLTKSKNYE